MQRAAARLRAVQRRDYGLVREELARFNRMINAPHVGHYHAPRAHVQVADFGVAHYPRRESDARARSFDERARILLAHLVVEGHRGERDGVTLALRAVAEAVEYDERERAFLFEQHGRLLN